MTNYRIPHWRLKEIERAFRPVGSAKQSANKRGADGGERQPDAYLDPKKAAATDRMKGVVDSVLQRLGAAESRARTRSATSRRIYERCVEMLVCNLTYRHVKGDGRAVMVPLSKTKLTPKTRPAPFMTEAFAGTATSVGNPTLGIAVLKKGSRDEGTVSTLSMGEWLERKLEEEGVTFLDLMEDPGQLCPPVILRDVKVRRKASRLPLPDDNQVPQLLHDMKVINDSIALADIEWTGRADVDVRARRLTRIFNNGTLEQGGRMFHGFWQALSKEERRSSLKLQGQRVVEVDFDSCGIRLAYSRAGIAPPDSTDLYELPGEMGSRVGVKRLLSALLCASEPPVRFPHGLKSYFPDVGFDTVYSAVCERHPALVPQFGTSQGLMHQRAESDIVVSALLELAEMGIVALPVHDCLLVGHEHAEVCRQVMQRAFHFHTGVEGRAEICG